jgi:heptosyltransferase-3
VIRRDNIGDLVCTTPMFTALRARFPDAKIAALVNSYNVAVLENNPDLDEVYAYTKAKHRAPGKSAIGVYWDRLRLFAKLRGEHFDYAIIAGAHFLPRALRLARWIKPRHIIGFTEAGKKGIEYIDTPVPYSLDHPLHETEDIFRVLAPLGITGTLPKLRVAASPAEIMSARTVLARSGGPATATMVGVHISARKLTQRWPAERFIELVRVLAQDKSRAFVLFWSPGDEKNPLHPGDDTKAREIMAALRGVRIVAFPTHQLRELIAGLSLCDQVICSDGGAMHLAAGLGKPILCFFGRSDATRWHPWGVPHVLLQPPSQEVTDINVAEAIAGFETLLGSVEELKRSAG